MLGGFWGMFTGLSLWVLKPYIAYQFGKSSIKKLYKHSKVKETESRPFEDDSKLVELEGMGHYF